MGRSELRHHYEILRRLKAARCPIEVDVPAVELESGRPPVRFTLEQGEPAFARVYDLPGGDIAVMLPAKLTILKPGVMFTDALVMPAWSAFPLDLEGVDQNRYFHRFTRLGPTWKPEILNDLLVGRPHPLRRCQWDGFIVATGWASVPADCEDGDWLHLELCLQDERGVDFSYDFTAAVDQRFKREYERGRQSRSATEAVTAKRNLFEPLDETRVAFDSRLRSEKLKGEESEMIDDVSLTDTKPSSAQDCHDIENFALDLNKPKRIVIPNQSNAVPPDGAVD